MKDFIDLVEQQLTNHLRQKLPTGTPGLTDAEGVTDLLLSKLVAQEQEVFAGVFLTHQPQPDAVFENLFAGWVDNTKAEPDEQFWDELLGPLLRHHAADLIVIHYHPDGNGCVQPIDYSAVPWFIETLAALDMRMLAYLVISHEGEFHFANV